MRHDAQLAALLVVWGERSSDYLTTMKSKKKGAARAQKSRSRGLWIAPDLERMIKGERGRRGLSDPPYAYFLQLADLVLKPASSSLPSSHGPMQDRSADREDTAETAEPGGRASPPARLRKTTAISLPRPPAFGPPKPPKLTLPKPQSPKRAKPVPGKPPKRSVPKLSVPKPPKRRR